MPQPSRRQHLIYVFMMQNTSLFHFKGLIPISYMDLTQMTLFMGGIPRFDWPFWGFQQRIELKNTQRSPTKEDSLEETQHFVGR